MKFVNFCLILVVLCIVISCNQQDQDDKDNNVINIISNDYGPKENNEAKNNESEVNNSITNNITDNITHNKADNATDNKTDDFSNNGAEAIDNSNNKLIMFHNGRGPMCIEQLEFLEKAEKCDKLIIEEYLTTEPDTYNLLLEFKSEYKESEGVSSDFRYLPITFANNHAYSGFDNSVKQMLKNDIEEICK